MANFHTSKTLRKKIVQHKNYKNLCRFVSNKLTLITSYQMMGAKVEHKYNKALDSSMRLL